MGFEAFPNIFQWNSAVFFSATTWSDGHVITSPGGVTLVNEDFHQAKTMEHIWSVMVYRCL